MENMIICDDSIGGLQDMDPYLMQDVYLLNIRKNNHHKSSCDDFADFLKL